MTKNRSGHICEKYERNLELQLQEAGAIDPSYEERWQILAHRNDNIWSKQFDL